MKNTWSVVSRSRGTRLRAVMIFLCSVLASVCFPEPFPVQDRQGKCEDAASLFSGARQEDGDNRQKFRKEWF